MANGDNQQPPQAAPAQPTPTQAQVPSHLADLRVQPADETTLQTVKRNLTPQVDTSRSALGPGHQLDSTDSPQQAGEQQYRESFGSPLEQAYGKMKSFLSDHEQHLSDKVLKPFRQGLDNMADDLEEAAGTGHTQTGGQLTPVTRLLAGGVGKALRFVPVGKDVRETAAALAVPPEMGPEGKIAKEESVGETYLKSLNREAPEVETVEKTGPRRNASGEPGGGGLEEQSRMASENNQGIKYFRERPGGKREVLAGVGRQDIKAGPGERIIRVEPNGKETVWDQAPPHRVQPLNRTRSQKPTG